MILDKGNITIFIKNKSDHIRESSLSHRAFLKDK